MFWTDENKHVITSVILETVTSGLNVLAGPRLFLAVSWWF